MFITQSDGRMKIQLYQPQAINEQGKRANQEDSIYPSAGAATSDDRLFLVCDGMGGHSKGEVASAAVCEGISSIMESFDTVDRAFTDNELQQVLAYAYDTLDAADVSMEGKMGTTLTMICLHKGGCLAAHIGDSRIYHLRPATGEVLYRSRDHSLVQQLYDVGQISYNEMAIHPQKNIITKAMQPNNDMRATATTVHITDIRPGDYFYLCSDGMLEHMEDDELMDILADDTTDEEKIRKLVRLTSGNADNHSAYLLHVKDVEAEDDDSQYASDEQEARATNKALNDKHKDTAWDTPPATTPDDSGKQQAKGTIVKIILAAVLALAAAAAIIFLS